MFCIFRFGHPALANSPSASSPACSTFININLPSPARAGICFFCRLAAKKQGENTLYTETVTDPAWGEPSLSWSHVTHPAEGPWRPRAQRGHVQSSSSHSCSAKLNIGQKQPFPQHQGWASRRWLHAEAISSLPLLGCSPWSRILPPLPS